MYFKQIVKEDLGCASYIVGCTTERVCAVIDPRLDMVDEILALASAKGMQIKAVIETHNHADHISGHGELAQRTGADIYVHEAAGVEYPHKNLKDGDVLRFGVAKLRVLHTPGHRPEHIALEVADTSRSEEPWLALTGDSLFIGDVARPDLAVPGEEGASMLYDSIFERLMKLEDGVEVYPAHVAGSLCGRGMSAKTSSTIGYERRHNPAAAPRPREQFVRDMNENLPQRPPNMYAIVERNRQDYGRMQTPQRPQRLHAQEFMAEMERGALVIDTRSPEKFAQGHIRGSFHVALHGSAFPTRVGFVAPAESRLLLLAEDETDAEEATTQLAVVGYTQIVGYLDSDLAAWQIENYPLERLTQVTVEQLQTILTEQARHPGLAAEQVLSVLDVRDKSEWDEGHIEGAMFAPYYSIDEEFKRGPRHNLLRPYEQLPLAVICGSGQRSMIACSILQRHGFTRLFNVTGGMEAWNEAGLPVVSGEDQKGALLSSISKI